MKGRFCLFIPAVRLRCSPIIPTFSSGHAHARTHTTAYRCLAVPAERGWVYAATQYRRHVFWLTARVYSRADAPVANLARALAGAFLYLYFSWYTAHRTTVYDLLRPAAVWYRIRS